MSLMHPTIDDSRDDLRDDTGLSEQPRHRSDSIESTRLYQSIKARLFETGDGPLRVGALRLIRRLGAGGMGEVFLAHDDELDRPVALKLVHAKLSHERRFGERMRREARALAKLAHPNVVHVYEVGEHEGRIYLAMEYIEGRNLGEWILFCTPTWRAVLDAYLDAGEGLAAAHAAGLTHRDFKPENVLRSNEGRIYVADFGLARADGSHEFEGLLDSCDAPATLDDQSLVGPRPAADDSDVLRSAGRAHGPGTTMLESAPGALLGTLSYMPLEQLRGGRADARSDQFAFCVALYQGLWGALPFTNSDVLAREAALVEGRPRVPPRGGVPRWVWPIVRRGLSRDPQQRWPDMRSLLDALRQAPLRRRLRRRVLAAGVTVSLASLGAWFGLTSEREHCVLDDGALIGVWDDDRRSAIRQAFERSKHDNALEAAEHGVARLDAWAASWLAARTASCEATWVHGLQSQVMLDRRSLCFERQLSQVAALVEVLANADERVVARAGQALSELPDLGACSSVALEGGDEPDVAIGLRPKIDAGYELLARARVARLVGQPQQAIELAEQARAVGVSFAHPPLALKAGAVLADVTIAGGELTQGIEQLRQLVLAAERAQLYELVASFRVQLARDAAGDFADSRLEQWLIDEAQVALDRVARADDPRVVVLQTARARIAEQTGDFAAAIEAHELAYTLAEGRVDESYRALLRLGVGTALYRNGQLEAARTELERTLAVARDLMGPRAPDVGKIEFDLGLIATDLGDFVAAQRHLGTSLAIDEAMWGPASLEVARDRFALAYLGYGMGEVAQACALIDEVLPVYRAKLGERHDETASAITAAALCRSHEGDLDGAIAGYHQALEIQQQLLGPEHRELGLLHSNIGSLLFEQGQLGASLAAHERALAILTAKLPDDHPELATPLAGIAQVRLRQGEAEQALADFERALEIADASRMTELAQLRFGLARALIEVHGPRARDRAEQLASEALAGFEATGLDTDAASVRAWLAK